MSLTLPLDEVTDWPHETETIITIQIGASLKVSLSCTNQGSCDCSIGGALHSYLAISNIQDITITGLDQTPYLDTVTHQEHSQIGALSIQQECDNIYYNTEGPICLHDPTLKRDIIVEKSGSLSTVVWNPWIEKSSGMKDLDSDDYLHFVCIEAANAQMDTRLLKPGQSHTLSTTITARPHSL